MPHVPDPTTSTPTRRRVGTLFGVGFIAVAVLILVASGPDTRLASIAVAVVVGGLGLDLVVSMARRRRPLLSRLGPLP